MPGGRSFGYLNPRPSHGLNLRRVPAAIGNPKAVRAVGAANGRNPVAIIVPCHRIIGSGGRPKLTGYGGGLWRKEWLLRHEGVLLVWGGSSGCRYWPPRLRLRIRLEKHQKRAQRGVPKLGPTIPAKSTSSFEQSLSHPSGCTLSFSFRGPKIGAHHIHLHHLRYLHAHRFLLRSLRNGELRNLRCAWQITKWNSKVISKERTCVSGEKYCQ